MNFLNSLIVLKDVIRHCSDGFAVVGRRYKYDCRVIVFKTGYGILFTVEFVCEFVVKRIMTYAANTVFVNLGVQTGCKHNLFFTQVATRAATISETVFPTSRSQRDLKENIVVESGIFYVIIVFILFTVETNFILFPTDFRTSCRFSSEKLVCVTACRNNLMDSGHFSIFADMIRAVNNHVVSAFAYAGRSHVIFNNGISCLVDMYIQNLITGSQCATTAFVVLGMTFRRFGRNQVRIQNEIVTESGIYFFNRLSAKLAGMAM